MVDYAWDDTHAACAACISVVAGICGSPGFGEDGGPATSTEITWPIDVALDAADNMYIAGERATLLHYSIVSTHCISAGAWQFSACHTCKIAVQKICTDCKLCLMQFWRTTLGRIALAGESTSCRTDLLGAVGVALGIYHTYIIQRKNVSNNH